MRLCFLVSRFWPAAESSPAAPRRWNPAPRAVPPTSTPSPTPVPAKATVNGEIIPLAEFNAELERFKAAQAELGNTVSDEEAVSTVLDDLFAQYLLAQGAEQAGFVVDDALLQERIDKLIGEVGGEDALSQWQTAHNYTPKSFRAALRRAIAAAWMRDQLAGQIAKSKDQVHVRQILFYNEERARQVLTDIQAGRTDFDEFAVLVDPVNSRRFRVVSTRVPARKGCGAGCIFAPGGAGQRCDRDRPGISYHQEFLNAKTARFHPTRC